MPTYSYRCTECGHAFDIQQAFSDSTLTECPTCGGALRKIFSPVGVSFTGSGFYRNDSRAAAKESGGSSTSSSSTPSSAPSSTPSSTPSPAAAPAASASGSSSSGSSSAKTSTT